MKSHDVIVVGGGHAGVEAADTYLADRLLFGTAFPIVPLKPMVEAFHRLPFKDGVRLKVDIRNAAGLLNLPASPRPPGRTRRPPCNRWVIGGFLLIRGVFFAQGRFPTEIVHHVGKVPARAGNNHVCRGAHNS